MLLSRRQGKSLRFFFFFSLDHSQPQSQFKQTHYHYHNRRSFIRDMAAAAAAKGIRSDLFFCKALYGRQAPSDSEFFWKLSVSTQSYRTAAINKAGCGCGGNFNLRGCFDSQPHDHPGRRPSLHSNSKTNNSSGLRSNDFEYHKAQLVRGLELDGISVDADSGQLRPNGLEKAYQRGNPLGFPHHPLPKDKIVVAVDVDEGLYISLNSLLVLAVFLVCISYS